MSQVQDQNHASPASKDENPPRSSISYPAHAHSASRRSSYQPFPPLSPTASASDPASTMPVRLPRPLTPGEMHMELEREQEAIVNRLTREITALQTAASTAAARRASTASNTSNAHASALHTPGPDPPTPGLFPMDSSTSDLRARRSESTASQRGLLGRSSSASLSVPREEVAAQRAELDDVKRENEMLKARIRELESRVREKKDERESAA